jgi:hypothetical protein
MAWCENHVEKLISWFICMTERDGGSAGVRPERADARDEE